MPQDFIGAARSVISGSSEMASVFESKFSKSIDAVCAAVDEALTAIVICDAAIQGMPEAKKKNLAHAIMSLARALNDIMASLHLLRCGYDSQALGVMRSALESWATAILMRHDESVWKRFMEGSYSTSDSVHKVLAHKAVQIPNEVKERIRESYKALHKFAHPTAVGMVSMLAPGGMTLGGQLNGAKAPEYGQILSGCRYMAMNIKNTVDDFPR